MNLKLTDSLEDYLEVIYIIGNNNPKVRITDIAHALGISKPSVNKAVGLLKKSNLVIHERYGNIILTEKGKKIAEDVYYMHNALKNFLVNELKIDSETAELEACRIEHVISKDSLDKLIEYSKDKNKSV